MKDCEKLALMDKIICRALEWGLGGEMNYEQTLIAVSAIAEFETEDDDERDDS